MLKEEESGTLGEAAGQREALAGGKAVKIFFDDVEIGNEEIESEAGAEKEATNGDGGMEKDHGKPGGVKGSSQSGSKYADDFKSSGSIHDSQKSQEGRREHEENSAKIIQRLYRSHLSKKFKGFPLQNSTIAATKIQKAYRSFKSNQKILI